MVGRRYCRKEILKEGDIVRTEIYCRDGDILGMEILYGGRN